MSAEQVGSPTATETEIIIILNAANIKAIATILGAGHHGREIVVVKNYPEARSIVKGRLERPDGRPALRVVNPSGTLLTVNMADVHEFTCGDLTIKFAAGGIRPS